MKNTRKSITSNFNILAEQYKLMETSFNSFQRLINTQESPTFTGIPEQMKLIAKKVKEQKIMLKDLEVMLHMNCKSDTRKSVFDKEDTNIDVTTGKTTKGHESASSVLHSPLRRPMFGPRNQETPVFGKSAYVTPKTTPSRIVINFNGIPIPNGRTVFNKNDQNLEIINVDEETTVFNIDSNLGRSKSPLRRGRYHEMEVELVKWMRETIAEGLVVNKYALIKKARELSKNDKFKASSYWYSGFLKRCDFI